MAQEAAGIVFDEERAASYEHRFEGLAAVVDGLHLSIRMVLADLPENSRVLCVGAGTGAELLALARMFPTWRFTAVDPAPAMLDICRQRVEEEGIASRCEFHSGYLDSLPPSEPFDAATSILVSHFLVEPGARRDFFREIASRLQPGGVLVSADLAGDMDSPCFDELFGVWARGFGFLDFTEEEVVAYRENFGPRVAVTAPAKVADLIASAGFSTPIQFYQGVLIHAWFAQRAT